MRTIQQIRESSLSRVQDHMKKHDAGFITAFRDGNTRSENKSLNRKMLATLMRKGYGVTSVKGAYVMDHGTDQAKEVGEPSFFVVDIKDSKKLHQDLIGLSIKFKQESVLLVDKGGKNARLHGTSKDSKFLDYGQTVAVGSGKYGKVAGEFLSRVRGREFAFEEFGSRADRYAAYVLEREDV